MKLDPTIRTAKTRDFYLAYLNSAGWRARRQRALKSAGFKCQQCSGRRDLQVHHKSYERLGAEWDEDLAVLCVDCHEATHIGQLEESNDRLYLKIAREALRLNPYTSFTDLSEDAKRLCARYKIAYDGEALARALQLITGTRLIKRDPHAKTRETPDPQKISPQEAHEILCQIGLQGHAVEMFVKPMPTIGLSDADQQDHEARVRRQADIFRQIRHKRRPIAERLAEIFGR